MVPATLLIPQQNSSSSHGIEFLSGTRSIIMPHTCPSPSLQFTGHANFWHPTGQIRRVLSS